MKFDFNLVSETTLDYILEMERLELVWGDSDEQREDKIRRDVLHHTLLDLNPDYRHYVAERHQAERAQSVAAVAESAAAVRGLAPSCIGRMASSSSTEGGGGSKRCRTYPCLGRGSSSSYTKPLA